MIRRIQQASESIQVVVLSHQKYLKYIVEFSEKGSGVDDLFLPQNIVSIKEYVKLAAVAYKT